MKTRKIREGKGKNGKSTYQQAGERHTPGCMNESGLDEKVQKSRGVRNIRLTSTTTLGKMVLESEVVRSLFVIQIVIIG